MYGGMEVEPHAFLTTALGGGEWSALHLQLLYSQGKSPRYPLDREMGGPQSWSGCGGEEKNRCFCWESNPSRPASGLVTILTEPLL
jgi:hypothetical protein